MLTNNPFIQVVKNPGFLNLWINQILVQLSFNSLNFVLLLWVYQLTGSSFAISALFLSIYMPTILLGLFSGVLVDIVDRRNIILTINILLSLSFLFLVVFNTNYIAILVITFIINALSQFFPPAEASAIPLIVKKEQLMTANAIFSSTLYICFLIGFGLAGPILDIFGIDLILIFGSGLLFFAFLLALNFPSINSKLDPHNKKLVEALKQKDWSSFKSKSLKEIKDTLIFLRGNITLQAAIFILAGVQTIVSILGVLIPSFFERVLHIQATNSSYVLIVPLGVGMIIGALFMGRVGYKIPRRIIISRSTLLSGLLFFAVGIAPVVAPVIKYLPKTRPLPFTSQLHLSSILALGAFLLGIMAVSVIVSAQTTLQENTPDNDRGKVFSMLGLIMAAFSLVPVLVVGVLSDYFGPQPIFFGIGTIIVVLGILMFNPELNYNRISAKFAQVMGVIK